MARVVINLAFAGIAGVVGIMFLGGDMMLIMGVAFLIVSMLSFLSFPDEVKEDDEYHYEPPLQ
jgi:hypothetical protein